MQVIVKTTYDGIEEKEVIENVLIIRSLKDKVMLTILGDDSRNKVQFIALDGYTDLIIR